MSNRITRRRFMVTAGAAASAVVGSSIFNVDTVMAAPYIRRNLGPMTASDPVLVSYRKAIKAMKLLPASNPLSWAYQAAIHGVPGPSLYTSWNTCEHGTPYFWSWHRMYLYWFERIIRKMSGDNGWALPYWDYISPAQRSLPVPFRDSSSELYLADRGPGWNAGTASYAASHVDPTFGNSFVDYFSGQSGLESNPHDNVHVDMGGAMGNPSTAAPDPVFYVHHSNIDRLWNLWLAQGGGRADPLSTASWRTKSYTFFDENGHPVNMTTCDILRAAQQLNYTYEGEPSQVNNFCLLPIRIPIYYLIPIILIHWPGPPVELNQEEVAIEINIKEFQQRLASVAESKTEFAVLELDNVEAARAPGAVWEVYLGLPPNAAPNPESPFFVGTMTLFGAGVREHAHGDFKPAKFTFRANRAILAALKSRQEQLRLVFVPSGPLMNGKPTRPKVQSPVRIGTVNISVAREELQGSGKIQERLEKPIDDRIKK
ncbi:MAG TPA: tyrosinase family protein [Candidatus Angelobacter sp.]|nr:tyrosinase family protein [Candidatus Angelobacter sp.]